MPSAYILMPVSASRSNGPAAVWITAAGWGSAAERRLGSAIMITPDGTFTPEGALAYATAPRPTISRMPSRRLVPEVLITLMKDLRSWRDARRFTEAAVAVWAADRSSASLTFIWQQHNLFQRAGAAVARSAGVPLVVFVDAPIVWEARRWGVRRPVWGPLLERFVEGRYLRAADLVLAVSDSVAREVARLGVDPGRILVTPCAVDLRRFEMVDVGPPSTGSDAELSPLTVVWIGSFRRFHGLDVLIEAMSKLSGSTVRLVLAGDGNDRARIEDLARDAGVPAEFLGSLAAEQIPGVLAGADVGVVTSRGDGDFHYSPLKLREYLAAGLAVVAPAEPDIVASVKDGRTALLYEPGDSTSLAARIEQLDDDREFGRQLGVCGRELARTELSWEHQFDRVADQLGLQRPSGSPE